MFAVTCESPTTWQDISLVATFGLFGLGFIISWWKWGRQ